MKIYVASSWRNDRQQSIVDYLRAAGHEVYDFKNPRPGDHGFSWAQIDPNWQQWTNEEYMRALTHQVAQDGFDSDFNAMEWADACVLVLPCGRSAHTEAGWFAGANKPVHVLLEKDKPAEPELMYKCFSSISETLPDLLANVDLYETTFGLKRK